MEPDWVFFKDLDVTCHWHWAQQPVSQIQPETAPQLLSFFAADPLYTPVPGKVWRSHQQFTCTHINHQLITRGGSVHAVWKGQSRTLVSMLLHLSCMENPGKWRRDSAGILESMNEPGPQRDTYHIILGGTEVTLSSRRYLQGSVTALRQASFQKRETLSGFQDRWTHKRRSSRARTATPTFLPWCTRVTWVVQERHVHNW